VKFTIECRFDLCEWCHGRVFSFDGLPDDWHVALRRGDGATLVLARACAAGDRVGWMHVGYIGDDGEAVL